MLRASELPSLEGNYWRCWNLEWPAAFSDWPGVCDGAVIVIADNVVNGEFMN